MNRVHNLRKAQSELSNAPGSHSLPTRAEPALLSTATSASNAPLLGRAGPSTSSAVLVPPRSEARSSLLSPPNSANTSPDNSAGAPLLRSLGTPPIPSATSIALATTPPTPPAQPPPPSPPPPTNLLVRWYRAACGFQVMPRSRFQEVQEAGMIAVSLAQVALVPIEIAFQASALPGLRGLIVRFIVLAYNLFDIWLQFRTAYYDKQGKLVTDRATIAARYRRNGLPYHVLACIPFDALVYPFTAESGPRYARLGCMFHLYRWYRLMADRGKSLQAKPASTLAIAAFFVLQGLHWCTCIWWFLQVLEQDDPVSWVRKEVPIDLYGDAAHPAPSIAVKYLYVLAFTLNVISAPGYGIFKSYSITEIAMSLAFNLTGTAAVAIYLASFISVLTNKLTVQTEMEQQVQTVLDYMRDHQLPPDLQDRAIEYYRLIWRLHQGRDTGNVLVELPGCMRGEIALQACGAALRLVPMFATASEPFLRLIATRCQERAFIAGEYIIRRGEKGTEMYLLHRGRADIVSDDLAKVWATLHGGSFFGEIALFANLPRTANVVTQTVCHLFVLHRADLTEVLRGFPQEEREIAGQVADRLAKLAAADSQRRVPAPARPAR
ncbi:hypothetical protein H9P43_002516 [Blastocladiella emersonii ATCC 22665]|nr:hypothetical protein H9P43_002516 [Blastocladiella emersonii ATCC 22665]